MSDTKLQMAREWIIKAKHDLDSARKLVSGDNPIWDTAVYHCQQAGEKSIKGFLLYHDIAFEKTHDVAALVAYASKVDGQFLSLLSSAELLTPYATAFRYPDEEIPEPSPHQFSQALESACQLYSAVIRVAPDLSPL